MKKILDKVKKYSFTGFPFVYLLFFLLPHAIEEFSWLVLIGIVVALWSHTRKGWLSPTLLLLHIGIEWVGWINYPAKILAWIARLGHSGADVVFYHHEISAHRRKNSWLYGGLIFIVIFISFSFLFEIPEEILEVLHQFALGGAVGCVSSHLYFHIHHEKP